MAIPDDRAAFLAVALSPGASADPRPLTTRQFEALTPRHSRVLRAALAMRGGVSLAVWIGGAAAEMDLWRRIRIREDEHGTPYAVFIPPSPSDVSASVGRSWLTRAEIYARLLDSRGFDSLEFDVMAGASAGGLNAVMYAVAQRAGADVDALLPVWRDVGSAWRLLRPPGFARVDSVLRGDGYFWPELRRILRDLYRSERISGEGNDGTTATVGDVLGIHPAHRANRITVDLSATLVDSEDASERGTQEGKGHFHFVGSDDRTASEHGRAIPSGAGRVLDADLARLAYAARTTSSFPGAFEPALIFSKTTRVPLTGPLIADAESVNMTFAFHAHRDDWSHPFRVVDGGVLDNVPIDRAFRAIRGMASTVNATRALLYLDPSPPMQPLASVRPTQYGRADADSMFARPHRVLDRLADRQSQLLSAIAAGRGKRGTRESGPDEEDEVERFRLALKQAQGRGEALAVFSDASVDEYDTQAAARAYVRFRSAADLQRLSLVMANPSLWQLGTNLPTRSNWRARSAEERSGFDHLFDETYDEMSRDPVLSSFVLAIVNGPQALIDATLSLLNWVRALEEVVGPRASVADVRLRVYEILARATDARDLCLRSMLDEAEELGAGAVVPARLADAVLTAWIRENADAVENVRPFWDVLDDCLEILRAASPHTNATPETAASAWLQVPWSGVPAQRADFGSTDLAPFLSATGIPEPMSALTFWRINGDEPASRAEDYTTLLERKMRTATRIALSLAKNDIDDEVLHRLYGTGLSSIDKLAGTTAFSFGGFLSKAWRINDWWWGRLDTAAGMTRFLNSYPPLDSTAKVPPVSNLTEAVQASVLADAARDSDRPFPSPLPEDAPARDIRAAFSRGGTTLRDLSPRYLLAILSRSIRVASRALSGSVTTSLRIVLAVLRPLLVLVPFAATPVRAAIAATILGMTITITAASAMVMVNPPDAWTIVPGLAVLVVILVGLSSGVAVAGSRWRRLIAALSPTPDSPENASATVASANAHLASPSTPSRHTVSTPPPAPAMDVSGRALRSALALRRRAFWQAALGAAAAFATLGIAGWPLFRDGLSVSFWILAISGAIVAVLARLWAQSPSAIRQPVLAFGGGALAYAAWVALVLALPGIVAGVARNTDGTGLFGLSGTDQLVAVTVTLAGLTLALLLTTGWLPIRADRPRTWLLNAGTVSVLSAIGAGGVVVISMLLRGTDFASLNIATTVILTVFVWGSLLWWIPEIPEGRSPAWTSAEVNDDLRD